MATAQLIDLTNFDTLLKQSSQGRSGSPDGNIYFDVTNGTIEFIPREQLAQIDLGSGLEDNPLTEQDGIKLEAVYAFENQERRVDESLRGVDRFTRGNFKFAGAYSFVNSRKPATDADRAILRGSGWNELARDNGVDRIYFGVKGLSNIENSSQPFYQLSEGGVPVDFSKPGQIDEAVQVFGSTANTPSDATAGDFDNRTYLAASVRTFGNNYDRKETTTDLGITQLGEFSTGIALNESEHLTSGAFSLSDVYGGSAIAPFSTMELEEVNSPQVEGGFNEADGNFSWILRNPNNANLNQCVAFLDALAQTDDDINAHPTNVTNGKRINTWYSYDANGRIVTRSGADGRGLFIENIPTSDEQRVVFTDDSGNLKTRPFSVGIEVSLGATAKADALSWYHCFFANDYNTSSAVTVLDGSGVEVKGNSSSANVNNIVGFSFDYDGDTVGGAAGTDKNCVFVCEGDGGATQAKTLFTITRVTTVSVTCEPGVETNV